MADLQTETPLHPTVGEQPPGWRWACYVAAALIGFPIMTIVGIVLIAQKQYRRIGWIIVGWSLAGLVLLVVALLAFGLGRSTPVNTYVAPTVSTPTSATVQTPSSTGSQGASLKLPTESESDSPVQVVTYMEAIYMKAYQTGNPGYFNHYYAPSDGAAHSSAVTQLNDGGHAYHYVLSDIHVVSSVDWNTPSFTATYTLANDGFPAHSREATFTWDSTTNEWEATQLQ